MDISFHLQEGHSHCAGRFAHIMESFTTHLGDVVFSSFYGETGSEKLSNFLCITLTNRYWSPDLSSSVSKLPVCPLTLSSSKGGTLLLGRKSTLAQR